MIQLRSYPLMLILSAIKFFLVSLARDIQYVRQSFKVAKVAWIWNWVLRTEEIPNKSLDKVLLFSRNQIFFMKNWKFWWAPTTVGLNTFCWNIPYVSHLSLSTKRCSWLFLFSLGLEFFANQKRSGFYTLTETSVFITFLLITQDLNKI